jgi:acyl-CoA synthetase (AMP-forming)/AMP-acid ligase II
VNDAPSIAAMFKSLPDVKDVAVVAFPDRRAGTGLYAFVEAATAMKETNLRAFITAAVGKTKAPERIQVVEALPRNSAGEIRKEILQLVAMNQLDSIAQLVKSDAEREVVGRVVAGRRNLRDRFTF